MSGDPVRDVPETPPPSKPKRTRRRVSDSEVAAPPPGVRLLTLGQAAYLLNVSVTTVRRSVDEGQIRQVLVMGCVRITREAVEDFIQAAEFTKAPTSEAVAIKAAEEKARRMPLPRTRVIADWNTGEDTYGVTLPPRERPRKSKIRG